MSTTLDNRHRLQTIRLATRGSKLALWQADFVKAQIEAAHGDVRIVVVPVTTTGDLVTDRPLHEIDGKALFIKELEECMARGDADIAVHCMKDFHTEVPDGFELPVIMARACERDALLSAAAVPNINGLPTGATVGTTSLRRMYALKRLRPDLSFKPLRGNIDTRVRRLQAGEYDAIVLANAGLQRLGIAHPHTLLLDHNEMLPAVGQGALGIETRRGDGYIISLVRALNDASAHAAVHAERSFVQALGATCKSAVGCHCRLHGGKLVLRGFVGNMDLMTEVAGVTSGDPADPQQVGYELARKLLGMGAARLLK